MIILKKVNKLYYIHLENYCGSFPYKIQYQLLSFRLS